MKIFQTLRQSYSEVLQVIQHKWHIFFLNCSRKSSLLVLLNVALFTSSNLQPPASILQPPASSLQPPSSSLQPLSSIIQPLASSIHPASSTQSSLLPRSAIPNILHRRRPGAHWPHWRVHGVCTVHSALFTVNCELCTVYCELCTVHCALCTVHWALYTVHCVQYIVHSALCTVHCALYTVCSLKANAVCSVPLCAFQLNM